MKAKWLFLVAVGLFSIAGVRGQDAKVTSTSASPPAKATPAANAKPGASASSPSRIEPAEGDRAYKANCARCHAAPRKFSERKMVTIMQHMQVRANLTERETQAILQYLTR